MVSEENIRPETRHHDVTRDVDDTEQQRDVAADDVTIDDVTADDVTTPTTSYDVDEFGGLDQPTTCSGSGRRRGPRTTIKTRQAGRYSTYLPGGIEGRVDLRWFTDRDDDQDQTAGSSEVDVRLDSETGETRARTAGHADGTEHARHTGARSIYSHIALAVA